MYHFNYSYNCIKTCLDKIFNNCKIAMENHGTVMFILSVPFNQLTILHALHKALYAF